MSCRSEADRKDCILPELDAPMRRSWAQLTVSNQSVGQTSGLRVCRASGPAAQCSPRKRELRPAEFSDSFCP